jgi:hypothetical protein
LQRSVNDEVIGCGRRRTVVGKASAACLLERLRAAAEPDR